MSCYVRKNGLYEIFEDLFSYSFWNESGVNYVMKHKKALVVIFASLGSA
jgi:hypothetical protein